MWIEGMARMSDVVSLLLGPRLIADGERVLGLPSEPRVDRDVSFRDIPR